MTVETQTAKVTANGNGVATSFSFSPIVIFTASNLLVVFTDTSGDETTLSEGVGATDYEVVVSEFPGTGSITYPADGISTELQTGESLTIKRVLTLEQTTDLENQGGYFPDVQETAFDKGTMIDLQQQEVIERSLALKLSDGGTAPTVQRTASGYLRWDATAVDIDAAAISTTAAASSDDVPQDVSLSAGAAGVAADFSRDDHVHLLPTVSVAKGGTGATTASAARTALGLAIGTDVQAFHALLADIAGITFAQGDVLYYNGTDIVNLGPGTSGQFLKTQGAAANPIWATISTALPAPDFTSSEQTVTADTKLDVAHSLGAIPAFATLTLRCKTTDLGYAADDEILFGGSIGGGGDGSVTVYKNATNVTLIQGAAIQLHSQSTFNLGTITTANWKWVVEAWT